jgi:hypothetical protein
VILGTIFLVLLSSSSFARSTQYSPDIPGDPFDSNNDGYDAGCEIDVASFLGASINGKIIKANAGDVLQVNATLSQRGGMFQSVFLTASSSAKGALEKPAQSYVKKSDLSVVNAPTTEVIREATKTLNFAFKPDAKGYQVITVKALGDTDAKSAKGGSTRTVCSRTFTVAVGEAKVPLVSLDKDKDGYTVATDCNDNDPKINPGAKEGWQPTGDINCDGQFTNYMDLKDVATVLDLRSNTNEPVDVGSGYSDTNIGFGDVNGDGYGDVVMGHEKDYLYPGDADGSPTLYTGGIAIYFGGPNSKLLQNNPMLQSVKPDAEIIGSDFESSAIGTSLSVADIDGDGLDDVLFLNGYGKNYTGKCNGLVAVYGRSNEEWATLDPAFLEKARPKGVAPDLGANCYKSEFWSAQNLGLYVTHAGPYTSGFDDYILTPDMQGDGTGDLVLMVSQPKTTAYFGIKPFTKPVITVISLSDQPGRHVLEDLYNQNGYRFVHNISSPYAFGEVVSSHDINLDGYQELIFSDPAASTNGGAGYVWVVWGGHSWENMSTKEFLLHGLSTDQPITVIVNNMPASNLGTSMIVGDFNGGGKRDLAIDFGIPLGQGEGLGQVALISGESLMAGGPGLKLLEISCGSPNQPANIACLDFGPEYYIAADRILGTRVNQSSKDTLMVPLRNRSDDLINLHMIDLAWKPTQVGYLDWQDHFTCLSDEIPFTGNALLSGYDFDGDNVDDILVAGRDSQAYLLPTD